MCGRAHKETTMAYIEISPGIVILTEVSFGDDMITITAEVDREITGYSRKMADETEKGIISLINAHVRDIKSWDHKE
jgi:hypothetical protein